MSPKCVLSLLTRLSSNFGNDSGEPEGIDPKKRESLILKPGMIRKTSVLRLCICISSMCCSDGFAHVLSLAPDVWFLGAILPFDVLNVLSLVYDGFHRNLQESFFRFGCQSDTEIPPQVFQNETFVVASRFLMCLQYGSDFVPDSQLT